MTIRIDLRTDLTDEVIARALPHIGRCMYAAPCIIGAMFPKDTFTRPMEGHSVKGLADAGTIKFPDEQQAGLAFRLQCTFDEGNEAEFLAAVENTRQALAQ